MQYLPSAWMSTGSNCHQNIPKITDFEWCPCCRTAAAAAALATTDAKTNVSLSIANDFVWIGVVDAVIWLNATFN